MNRKPQISIIMSVYNGEKYLAEAIDSIIAQTFTDWELIVINDCSTDLTGDILERYSVADSRIKVHTNEVNLKLPTSLNKAISLSTGRYIARMDADDICLPDRFEKQFAYMEENPDIFLSSCRFLTLKNGVAAPGGCGGRCDSEALKAMLLVTNPILHPGVIARAELLKEFEYDTTLTCTEDLELWIRMAKQNIKMEILPEYLLLYRLHDKQITSTTLEKQRTEVLKIQRSYYERYLNPMDEMTENFYIQGIYFNTDLDIKKFLSFSKWIKKVNRKRKLINKDAIDYALFDVLAEYKRHGMSKVEILFGMLSFNPIFLLKELVRRKIVANCDAMMCLQAAEKIGLERVSGTKVFPIFKKTTERE